MTAAAIIALLVAGVATLYAIWRTLQPGTVPGSGVPELVLAILALIVLLGIHSHDKRVAARVALEQQQLAQGYLPVEHAQISVNLNERCPPRTDGMTDQLVMLITTQADHQPEITGCLRIAQRPYLVKEKK